jgi:hypothetical protein
MAHHDECQLFVCPHARWGQSVIKVEMHDASVSDFRSLWRIPRAQGASGVYLEFTKSETGGKTVVEHDLSMYALLVDVRLSTRRCNSKPHQAMCLAVLS